jgi:hypothetical protein
MPPGSRALAFASRWFAPHTVSTVFEPLVADWQREWQDAKRLRRIGIWIRGAAALLTAIIASSPHLLRAPSPPGVMRRVITRLMIWTTVATVLNVAPFVRDLGHKLDSGITLYLLVLLLPQALALAFPMAIATVVDVIRTAPRPTRQERITALRLAMAACALMFFLDGWVFPAANQEFRVITTRAVMGDTYRRGPAPGGNELSLVQLTRNWRRPQLGNPFNSDVALRELNKRVYLMLIPVFFIWARWRALSRPRGHWYSAAPLILAAPLLILFSYTVLAGYRALPDVFYAPRWSGVWLGLAFMIVVTVGIDRVRRRVSALA